MAEEPPLKRTKTTLEFENYITNISNSKSNLEAVLSDEYCSPIPLVTVYTGYIKDQKKLSSTIQILNQKLPLKGLEHLKRVSKSYVILCPISYLSTNKTIQESIQEFLLQHVPELSDSFDYYKNIEVPALPPKSKKQHLECNRNWVCNFHPNKNLEKLINKTFFKNNEIITHRTNMTLAFEVAKYCSENLNLNVTQEDLLSSINAAVVYDPMIDSIVAIAFDQRQSHPIQHASMLAIDNVAKTQNGGVWQTNKDSILGIERDLLCYLKKRYPAISFGARAFIPKKEMVTKEDLDCPYLCTGYYIYLLREPCLMCSMGLVHARVKRVFYSFENIQGALSKTKLHCVQSLNHRFEVFTGFL